MSKLIEMYVHLTADEEETLMFFYKDKMAMKFAISRLIDKELEKHCEHLKMTDKWIYRNSVEETEEESK